MGNGGRAALVTGSTSGIGHSIAHKFARMGYAVALSSFESETGIVDALVSFGDAEARCPVAAHRLAGDVIEVFGHPGILVDNAGYPEGRCHRGLPARRLGSHPRRQPCFHLPHQARRAPRHDGGWTAK